MENLRFLAAISIVNVMFLTSNLSQIGSTYQSIYLAYFEGPRLRLVVDRQKKTVVRESYFWISGASCLHPSRKAKLLGYNDVPATHVIFVMIGLHYYLLYAQFSKKCPRLYLILALNER